MLRSPVSRELGNLFGCCLWPADITICRLPTVDSRIQELSSKDENLQILTGCNAGSMQRKKKAIQRAGYFALSADVLLSSGPVCDVTP